MLGIHYESSDEEEVVPAQAEVSHANTTSEGAIATNIELPKPSTPIAPAAKPARIPVEESSKPPGPINGPDQGPAVIPPPVEEGLADHVQPSPLNTSTRMTIQNLTLPTVPNWDIPPSPPGSPPQRSSKKFTQFLDLKKKGQHFNQRLENSSVLRDPSHLRKLMDFAGVGQEDQYTSTLPEGLGVPVTWPEWAYGDELIASQKKIAEARAKVPRDSIDFVRSSSQSTGKRKDLEHRGGKDSSRSTWRSRSRSPKRRRSRSRERR
ncbi:hypothetical protein K458DRAFT_340555 [Lentithecium fluviatile CBS 122367]|uniref:HCNGP-domain-containing protein n=1 Tax=Lentithecium fluviatile CBS 122367 TaxID=1168545 RepID=A0A6G1IZS9_9PLEO|nr:hypothetical protein K458DRAFT_340555 [Lentithecium fluviatile CBS 122367]